MSGIDLPELKAIAMGDNSFIGDEDDKYRVQEEYSKFTNIFKMKSRKFVY